jgi:predicted RNA binding protein YcfA (HicA-like mRNA interferase family)
MNSKDIIRILELDGWIRHTQKGSHCQYKHPRKKGKVTVPHPKKDLPKKTVQSIFKQAGIIGLN